MKSILRKKYIHIRKNISNKLDKSLIIKDKVLSLLDKYQVIGVYASMDDEVSTDELIIELLNQSKIVVLPKIEGDVINFYQISSLDELKANGRYNIREPIGHNKPINALQAIIVPGICFDMNGYRLGFGRAYYDKYLKDKDIFKIGICFKELLVDSLPIDEWDVKMDVVVTD